MNDSVDFSIRQFSQAWQIMCSGSPGYTREIVEGIDYIFAGLPIGFFNVALLTARAVSSDALKAHGNDACAWASGRDVPWLFVVTHDALAAGVDAAAVLDGCGLAAMMPLTGMLAERIAPASRVPDGLDLTVPDEDDSCSALLDVNSAAYGMALDASKPVIGTRSFWKDHVPVIGRAGGTPASGAAVMMVDGHRYVALVATDPAHQRRGYAEAAMRRALDVAAQRHGEVMEKRFLEGH